VTWSTYKVQQSFSFLSSFFLPFNPIKIHLSNLEKGMLRNGIWKLNELLIGILSHFLKFWGLFVKGHHRWKKLEFFCCYVIIDEKKLNFLRWRGFDEIVLGSFWQWAYCAWFFCLLSLEAYFWNFFQATLNRWIVSFGFALACM